ncbi:TRIM56 [Branchiostoma lanceolatum]|uniref:TRIM56 protein n=1 Tax=Branchiostoma lanceolatum TaxID=7740 RepID=A0A8K0EF21_BRALA|nr:TRIM56 [Branchiostoma lanceolatum]
MAKRKSSKAKEGPKPKEEVKDDGLLSKISGDFLECTICLEPFKDPKILPCLHTFCEGCLKKFVAQDKVKNKFQCPTCRTETVLPKGGVASFKSNFFVQSLSDTVQAHKTLVSKEDDKVPCNVCEEEVASRGCVPCEEFLCDECACAHHRAKRTRSHEVIGVAELKEQLITKTGSLKSKSLPFCPKHEEEKLKFYCETCKHPICRDCTVLQHKNHQYGYLADAVGNVRAKIKNKLKTARHKIKKYGDKANAVATKQAELDTRCQKAEDDIDAAAEEEIKLFSGLVKSKQTALKEKLAGIKAARSKQLSATADSVESTLGCLSSTVNVSQKVVEHGSDFDVMNVYSDATTRLESLLEGPSQDIADNISYITFNPKKERKEKGVVLGNIVEKEIVQEELEEEEESRAEATFRFTVENFTEDQVSPATFIHNLPWRIEVGPEEDPDSQLPDNKTLGVYLKCDVDSKCLWSCRASVELRLIPQKKGVKTIKDEFEHVFYSNERNWGCPKFIPWHEVCDPQKGYIKDDKIILEAYVKAEAPLGEKEPVLPNCNTVNEDRQEEETLEENNSQAEATFRFTMKNFSKITTSEFSRAAFIRNLPWKISAGPEDDPDSQASNNKTLGIYLECDPDSDSLWSCRA